MSLRSDPSTNPQKPDPTTRNQPDLNINEEERSGTEGIPGNYPTTPRDSTSSGGYGASPDKIWSNKSQRGIDMPSGVQERVGNRSGFSDDTGLIEQTVDGTNLKNEIQDAKQGWDNGNGEQDSWVVEKGAEKDF